MNRPREVLKAFSRFFGRVPTPVGSPAGSIYIPTRPLLSGDPIATPLGRKGERVTDFCSELLTGFFSECIALEEKGGKWPLESIFFYNGLVPTPAADGSGPFGQPAHRFSSRFCNPLPEVVTPRLSGSLSNWCCHVLSSINVFFGSCQLSGGWGKSVRQKLAHPEVVLVRSRRQFPGGNDEKIYFKKCMFFKDQVFKPNHEASSPNLVSHFWLILIKLKFNLNNKSPEFQVSLPNTSPPPRLARWFNFCPTTRS